MRNLSDTIARLAAFRAQNAIRTPDLGGGSRLSKLDGFGANPGALEARFYCPDNLADGAPLVVVLHGCTQDASAYDRGAGWSQLADEAGFALLFPEQSRANNPNLCFNWFLPGDNRRDVGEAASIRAMVDALVTARKLDRNRIFVTGLSAGGAMASVMLACYPEVFAGGAIIAGLAHGTANTIPEAFDRMRGHGLPSEPQLQHLLRQAAPASAAWPRISVWQGLADQTVAPANADAIVAQWRGVHPVGDRPARSETAGGHKRLTWTDAGGEPLIELNTIAGMGHGTPLGTAGSDGLGAAGPFMLDVGVSSTRQIAAFWGIADADAAPSGKARPSVPERAAPSRGGERVLHGTILGPDDDDAAPVRPASPAGPDGVRGIIEDALRKAGLMR